MSLLLNGREQFGEINGTIQCIIWKNTKIYMEDVHIPSHTSISTIDMSASFHASRTCNVRLNKIDANPFLFSLCSAVQSIIRIWIPSLLS